jgi:hypothetical protein
MTSALIACTGVCKNALNGFPVDDTQFILAIRDIRLTIWIPDGSGGFVTYERCGIFFSKDRTYKMKVDMPPRVWK